MKLTLRLTDALHARPANLLVRLASRHEAVIELRKGTCRANAKNILEVLSLGAAKGEDVEVETTGQGHDVAAEALRELVERAFDADLVPETGVGQVEGIAIGRAVVVPPPEAASGARGSVDEERSRMLAAIASVEGEVRALVEALGAKEAALFEPELAILAALAPRLVRLVEEGESPDAAVRAATSEAATDLVVDARTRLLEVLTGGRATVPEAAADGDVIIVTESLTPSLVAFLPKNVVGIVAAAEEGATPGFTSHAAILARGRNIPLASVPPHVAASIVDGDNVVVDTSASPARVWVSPSDALVEDARRRRDAQRRAHAEAERRAEARLEHLDLVVRVNVGSLSDVLPSGAEGVGLLRTELLFAGRAAAPAEAEQIAVTLAVAQKPFALPIVARLFDAGGDKPLSWLAPPADAPDARGIELLCLHAELLAMQVRALCRAAESADVRILLPLVRSAEDIHAVRKLCPRPVPVGAMIESPAAVERIDSIAAAADFVCIGTNDLAALALGVDRANAALSLDPRVVDLVRLTIVGAHAQGKPVTVCGEMAGDACGAAILVGLGVDALSVAPARFASVKLALAHTTRDECIEVARRSLPKSA